MKISSVRISNYKAIKTVSITPEADAYLMLIAGPNAAGKTSIIEAIDALIGGKDAVAADPVRHGEELAEIEGRYDNGLTITRTIEPDGKTSLVVKDDTGKVRSPQALLDKMLGARTLDPLAFMRLPPGDQRANLLEIIDKDKVIPKIDAQRDRVYEARTEIGRKLKDAEGEAHRLGHPVEVEAPIDVAELAAELAALTAKQQAGQKVELRHRAATANLEAGARASGQAVERIAKLERELDDARRDHKLRSDELAAHQTTLNATQKELDATVAEWSALLPRRDAIAADLKRADVHNRAVVEAEQLNRRRTDAQKVVDDRTKQYAEGGKELDKIDAKKLAFLKSAKLPVDGLGLAKSGLTFNDVPLEQASGAEKLRVSLAIAIAAQSEIRDILIRDASLLDDESLRMVEEVAAASQYRVWCERVGTRDPGALIIRNGELVE